MARFWSRQRPANQLSRIAVAVASESLLTKANHYGTRASVASEHVMDRNAVESSRATALGVLRDELSKATAATKCHACGCFSQTIEALENAAGSIHELVPIADSARRVLVATKYDCLGCQVCFPALAVNAFSEAFPDSLPEVALCPTEAPTERAGWPPLPGEYSVIRYRASVAVCTLNSENPVTELAKAAPDGLALAGTLRTENLGIERIIRNLLANPNIRFLVLCGDDTRQSVGHLPGQSVESLFSNGIDDKQRIVGAKGRRPFLKNVTAAQVKAFRSQIQLVSMIGEQDPDRIAQRIVTLHSQGLPPFEGAGTGEPSVATVHAREPQFFKSDPTGFFVVYPDHRKKQLVVEHYTNAGILNCVVEGSTPVAVYMEIVRRELVSQLDHAAYLGRELANAERSLQTNERYIQDRAPGEPMPANASPEATCGPSCTTCH